MTGKETLKKHIFLAPQPHGKNGKIKVMTEVKETLLLTYIAPHNATALSGWLTI